MDDLASARVAFSRAIDDVQRAISRVRSAQEVDWVSAFAARYREELYGAAQDLTRFRDGLYELRDGVS